LTNIERASERVGSALALAAIHLQRLAAHPGQVPLSDVAEVARLILDEAHRAETSADNQRGRK
jgi:hypothetical protein